MSPEIVEDKVIVEIKAVEGNFTDVHIAQILTYMKLSQIRLGLLVNFNVKRLKNGIKRVVLLNLIKILFVCLVSFFCGEKKIDL